MKVKILSLILFIFFSAQTYAIGENPYPFSSAKEAARFQDLIKEIRCVVCQNQSIADSNAPLANDLREKIYVMVSEKKSNEEVKEYLVKRYGEFILLEPRFNKLTLLLWLFPILGITCAFILLVRFNARQKTD